MVSLNRQGRGACWNGQNKIQSFECDWYEITFRHKDISYLLAAAILRKFVVKSLLKCHWVIQTRCLQRFATVWRARKRKTDVKFKGVCDTSNRAKRGTVAMATSKSQIRFLNQRCGREKNEGPGLIFAEKRHGWDWECDGTWSNEKSRSHLQRRIGNYCFICIFWRSFAWNAAGYFAELNTKNQGRNISDFLNMKIQRNYLCLNANT